MTRRYWFCCAFCAVLPVGAAVLRVPADFPLIQIAINAAADGDTVLITDGVYTGGFNVNIDFGGKAITVTSENGPELTVIDCQGGLRGVRFVTGEGNDSVLSGITIRNGNGDGVPSGGGAILCVESSPRIENCRFETSCTVFGGALHVAGGAPIVRSCTFTRNYALESGGGIFCTGVCRAAFDSCDFTENYGGAIACRGADAAPRFESCRFTGNSGSFGQIDCQSGAVPSFARCTITSGTHAVHCFDRASPTFTDCLITGNSGTVAWARSGSTPSFVHCTVAENYSSNSPLFDFNFGPDPEARVLLESSIVWGNAGEVARSADKARVEAMYSLIQGDALWPGLRNRAGDPRFAASGSFDFDRYQSAEVTCGTILIPDFVAAPGDYHLLPGSPAVDGGNPDSAISLDLEGSTRPCGAGFDMGAYELGACLPLTLTVSPNPVRVGNWGRELVTAWLRDTAGRGIAGAAVEFVSGDPGLVSFSHAEATTDANGMAYTVLEAQLPPNPEELRASFTASSRGIEAGVIDVEGVNFVSDGPIDFHAQPLAPFVGHVQKLSGEACGFVFPEDVGRPVDAWSIDPTIAEISGGAVTLFLEGEHCDRMEFDVTAHRPGTAVFIIGTVDLSVYEAVIAFDTHFRRGDSNGDGILDLSDAINTLGYLFGGAGAVVCEDAADSNDSGDVDISDGIHTLGFLFGGGPPPPAPGHEDCGSDLTGDDLLCILAPGCS